MKRHCSGNIQQGLDYITLGALARLLKQIISFVMSVRPSFRLSAWNNSAYAGRIFAKFDIQVFF
jgi:hypothetical protein